MRSYLVVGGLFGILLTVVGALESNGTAPLITGCFLLLMVGAFGYVVIRNSSGPIVMTPSEIVLPVRARAKVRIPLADVRGVGLVCVAGGRSLSGALWSGMERVPRCRVQRSLQTKDRTCSWRSKESVTNSGACTTRLSSVRAN